MLSVLWHGHLCECGDLVGVRADPGGGGGVSQEIGVVGSAKLIFVGGNFEVVLSKASAEGAEWILATWVAESGSKTMTYHPR